MVGGVFLRAVRPSGAEFRRVASILLRLLAGAGGGYGLAALFAAALPPLLPLPRAEAVLTATMASFAVHATAILWAFGTRTVLRAWAGIALPALTLGIILLAGGHTR
ncbi:DUF3649 domain-containing protein [Pseudoroseomonas globiformis]|uniref:DUF3649 domain-containing protein n=1 Tax=Teichococcus globiformis TaxID=2307229 RepID=A0ABV7FWV1_9PROT